MRWVSGVERDMWIPVSSYQFPTNFYLKRARLCVFCDFAF
jgi:hypothetical protein